MMKMVKQSGSVESGEVLVRELDFLVRMWIWDVSDFFFVDLVIEWDHLVDLLQKKKKGDRQRLSGFLRVTGPRLCFIEARLSCFSFSLWVGNLTNTCVKRKFTLLTYRTSLFVCALVAYDGTEMV